MGLQGVSGAGGGGQLPAGAPSDPLIDTALSNTVVTEPAAKQRTQTQAKVGRRQVVARFDVRPQRSLQLPDGHSWLNVVCSSCPRGVSAHQLDGTVSTVNAVTDVNQVTTLPTDGEQTSSL